MARLSALLALSDNFRIWLTQPGVASYLASMGLAAPNVTACGWKQREQQLNQGPGRANRVIFIPGTIDGDSLGDITEPRRSGDPTQRTLFTWERTITASLWACDKSATADEEAQIEASENLLQLTVAGIQAVASADWIATRTRRDSKASENMPFGQEILLEFLHRELLIDLPQRVRGNVTPVVNKQPSS